MVCSQAKKQDREAFNALLRLVVPKLKSRHGGYLARVPNPHFVVSLAPYSRVAV
jgi:ribosomal protein L17